ncbi:MFS general substrate transporter, partial [Piromyces finnis]
SLDMTVVATALPTIAREFGDISGYTWVITSYMLSSTAFQPMYGKFADIFGRRVMMIFALVIFIASSIFCGISKNMDMLIIFRGIQGIGGGGLMSLCMIIIADIIPIRKRGQYMGILGAVFSFSTVIGPLVGGLFTDNISWRWAFYINVPLAVIAFIIIFLYVKIPTPSDNLRKKLLRVDYAGTIVLILGVVALLLALEWGVAFITIEIKFAKEPIIPPAIFKVRNINCMIVACTLIGFAFMGACTYLPLTSKCGIYIGKHGHVNILFIIGFIFLLASGYVYSLLGLHTSTVIQLLIIGFGALGSGLTRQNMILVAQDSAPKALLASTTAVISFFQVIGGIVGFSFCHVKKNVRLNKKPQESKESDNSTVIDETSNPDMKEIDDNTTVADGSTVVDIGNQDDSF